MISVIYPPNVADFFSFGFGVLTDTISCEVTEERNGVFECLLKYPVSGHHCGIWRRRGRAFLCTEAHLINLRTRVIR